MLPRARRLLLASALAAAAACAAIPRAPKDRDAAAKTFATTPDKANLYVFRDSQVADALPATVLLDGKNLGATVGRTFLLAQIDPGPHTLESRGDNDAELAITAEAGKNLFVWQETSRGFLKPRTQLHVVDEARGQAGVAACELALPVALE
jgi:hypothetical protein